VKRKGRFLKRLSMKRWIKHEELFEQANRNYDGNVLWRHGYLTVAFDQVKTGKNVQPFSLFNRSRMMGRGE
jgi:hypothetical protein